MFAFPHFFLLFFLRSCNFLITFLFVFRKLDELKSDVYVNLDLVILS